MEKLTKSFYICLILMQLLLLDLYADNFIPCV